MYSELEEWIDKYAQESPFGITRLSNDYKQWSQMTGFSILPSYKWYILFLYCIKIAHFSSPEPKTQVRY